MATLSAAFAESVLQVLTSQGQNENENENEARACIRAGLMDRNLAIRTIQTIVSSDAFRARNPSPEAFAGLLFEFIDPCIINGLIATPYDPTDTESIEATASLLSCVSQDKRKTMPFFPFSFPFGLHTGSSYLPYFAYFFPVPFLF